jgi:hypothetical protein
MTVSENEEAIYKQLNKNRLKLYATLSKKINSDTNDYFYINDGISIYYPDLENLEEYTLWNPNPNKPCSCPQFKNEGNGVVSFLGAVFKTGWKNTEQWEMVADIKFGRLWKTGLILLTDANNPFPSNVWGSESSGRWGISAWERFIGTPYTLNGNPHYEITYEGDSQKFTQFYGNWANNVWHSLHMKKVSSTRLIVWLDDNENDRIIYDWEELSDVEQVTFGATMNHNTSDYGHCTADPYPLMRLYVRDLYVFYPSLPANKLTALCEDTKKILSNVNNLATIPEIYSPEEIPTTLAQKELDIHNRIQYCNNVLRYTLRKNGIDFQNSNIMQELIKYIDDIESSRRKIYFYLYDGDTSTPAGDLNIGCPLLSSDPEGNVELIMRWDSENSRYVGKHEVSKTFYESEDWTFDSVIPGIKKSNHHVISDPIQLTETQTDANGYKLAEIGIIQNKKIVIPVSINWNDNSNSQGLRPASVTVYYQSQSVSTVLSNTNSYEGNLLIPENISFDKNNLTTNTIIGYTSPEITENINAAQIAEYILTYTIRSGGSSPPTPPESP